MTKPPPLIVGVETAIKTSVSQTSKVHAPEVVVQRAGPCPGSWC